MKWIFISGWILFSVLRAQAVEATASAIEHRVMERETLWFLASLYYGKASEYKKIMESNHFQHPEDMKEGMQIQIHGPKYTPNKRTFAERYTDLWNKRELALISMKTNVASRSGVIPIERIRQMDTVQTLPFELAPQERVKGSRESSRDHGY